MNDNSLATRVALIQSNRTWSSLEEVALAVSVASATERRLYVERRADRFRWGLVHTGGAYPLLRITARFLGVDHYRIVVGFRTLPDGSALLCEDPDQVDEPDEWAILDLPLSIPADATAELIAATITVGLGTA